MTFNLEHNILASLPAEENGLVNVVYSDTPKVCLFQIAQTFWRILSLFGFFVGKCNKLVQQTIWMQMCNYFDTTSFAPFQ